jgi:hypothetical protein
VPRLPSTIVDAQRPTKSAEAASAIAKATPDGRPDEANFCQASLDFVDERAASAIDRGGVGTEYRWIAGSAHASSKKFASEFDQG